MGINQEQVARVSSSERSSSTSDLAEEGSNAPLDHEGTSTAGRQVSDDEEAYEAAFSVPVVAPPGATLGLDQPRDPAGPSSAKKKDRRNADEVAQASKRSIKTSKRKATKPAKKKMRAPDSEEEKPTRQPGPKRAGARRTPEDLDRDLCLSELSRTMIKDPILKLLKPTLVGELKGPVMDPDLSSITSVRQAARAIFRLVEEAGYRLGSFDTGRLYEWELLSWKLTMSKLLELFQELVGTTSIKMGQTLRVRDNATDAGSTGSSRYLSASSIAGSSYESSDEARTRMKMPEYALEAVRRGAERPMAPIKADHTPRTEARMDRPPPIGIEDAFARMMQSYVDRQTPNVRQPTLPPTPMEVDESASPHPYLDQRHHAYPADDPEDLFGLYGSEPSQRAVAAATAGVPSPVTRVRISAFSELKEFSGRDSSDEKARSWFNRVRAAARRDGMGTEEVCSLFGDLMAGPARQWYLQLGRDIRGSWPALTEQFLIQYCGKGVSLASRYYHATKRSDETPLDYLYRLNVAGIRAGLHIMDGNADQKREHVDHFVWTLSNQDPDLAMQLTMLMIPDVPVLENVLRKRQRNLDQQKKSLFGSNKFRQKAPAQATPPPRQVHLVQADASIKDSDQVHSDVDQYSDYDHDREEFERSRVHVAAQQDPDHGSRVNRADPRLDQRPQRPPCRHCQSVRHDQADCWKLLTCGKCGGHHPSDRCLRSCKACGDVHGEGECPMEEFFNLLRQWYDPHKHAGMLPQSAEKMLN